jgi:hypothetical protein
MKAVFFALAATLSVSGVVLAQSNQQTVDRAAAATAGEVVRTSIGMGSKTMASCTADRRRLCTAASDYMAKECLVKNWTVLSNDCQDALGKPFDATQHGD